VAVSRAEQPGAVAALVEDAVSAFEAGDAGPGKVIRVYVDAFLFNAHLHPIIGAADHDGADRRHLVYRFSFRCAAVETAFHRLSHCDGLRYGETDGCVDRYTLVGGFFDRFNPGAGDRSFDLHIWCKCIKVDGMIGNTFGIAVQLRVGLDGEAAFFAFFTVIDRF